MVVPSIINVELTNRCNMECVFCDHSILRKTMPIGDMEKGLFEFILKGVSGFNIYELGLVGLGEPLLNEYLNEHLQIISKYKKMFERISLNSNGTLMDAGKAKLVLDSAVNLVTFSLNATSRESYKMLMQRDLFDTVVENIKCFIKNRVKYGREDMNVSIQFISSDLNQENQMRKIFEGYMADKVIIYNRYVFNKPGFSEQGKGWVNVNQADFSGRYPCWSMYSRVYVDIEGNVYPCTIGNDCYRGDSQLCIGNVAENNLLDIYNGKCMQKARQDAQDNKIPFAECRECTLWELFPNNFEFAGGKWIYRETDKIRREELDRED